MHAEKAQEGKLPSLRETEAFFKNLITAETLEKPNMIVRSDPFLTARGMFTRFWVSSGETETNNER